MRSSITSRTIAEMNQHWIERISTEYKELETAKDLAIFLSDARYNNTIAFTLCRAVQEIYGAHHGERCILHLPCGTYNVKSVENTSFDCIAQDELALLSTSLTHLSSFNGFSNVFPKKFFNKILSGKKAGLSRESCFKLSFALGFSSDYVCELLEAAGERPYLFRSPQECIYYFCQSSERWNHWADAQSMWERYQQQTVNSSASLPIEGQTHEISDFIDLLLCTAEETPNTAETFERMLIESAPILSGYSLHSFGAFKKLVYELMELSKSATPQALTAVLWSPIWMQHYAKTKENGSDMGDFIPWSNLLTLPKTIFEKPLWRGRMNLLLSHRIPVEKRDILFLSCMKWYYQDRCTGGKEILNEFIFETNNLLLDCGLSVLYPPNSYDRLIMLSVCRQDPIDVLSDVFEVSVKQDNKI